MNISNYPPVFTYEFRVSTFETDRQGLITPSVILRRQQEAGERHLSAVGLGSLALLRRGWAFVGPTNCYAFMQAMGLVNDHLSGCFVRDEVEEARRTFRRPG